MRDLWRYIIAGMVAALLLAAIIGAAQAQQSLCIPRVDLGKFLLEKHGERPVQRGISNGGKAVIELFASPSGSWTLMVTNGDMISCPLANGQGWEALALGPQGDPA